MAKKYYDKDKLNEIMTKENSDPYGTYRNLEMYRSQYPQDRMSLQYCIRILIKLDRLD